MNKRIAIGLAVMAMTATVVQAAAITNAAVNGLWSNSATWQGGVVPGTVVAGADIVRIRTGNTITLDSNVAQPLGNVQVGRVTAGTLVVTNGGVLGMLTASTLEIGSTGVGSFTLYTGGTVTGKTVVVSAQALTSAGSSIAIHGGNMSLSGPITVGKAANGSLTIDGGSVLANSLALGDAGNLYNGSSSLTGGALELTAANALTINTASKLTIGNDATLIWAGNKVANIGTFVTANNIIWSSGSSALGLTYGVGDQTWTNGIYFLHADYSSIDSKTRVWADTIPEPATIGMIGLGALITLLIRRFSGR